MKKVEQFESRLKKIDVFLTVVVALFAAFGVFSSIASGIQFGLGLIISALMLWVTKFFVYGISYTFIQIAKNTNPNTIDEDA
ncbi:Eukaryotic-type low-affinity urea transporter [Vibrio jasicida]|uniref:hypothetical protein n=1 Tax=Vibrio jasicida TaxID=766224 RepID=UPI002895E592|nr:Eukaryotic-type low-affinity urea transporter [Vibrio jasicida]